MGENAEDMSTGFLCSRCGMPFSDEYYQRVEEINMSIIHQAEKDGTIDDLLDEDGECEISSPGYPVLCDECWEEDGCDDDTPSESNTINSVHIIVPPEECL